MGMSEHDVAVPAENTPHYPRLVVVIGMPTTPVARIVRSTDRTASTLRIEHRVPLCGRDAMLSKRGEPIDLPNLIWVLRPPCCRFRATRGRVALILLARPLSFIFDPSLVERSSGAGRLCFRGIPTTVSKDLVAVLSSPFHEVGAPSGAPFLRVRPAHGPSGDYTSPNRAIYSLSSVPKTRGRGMVQKSQVHHSVPPIHSS